LLSDGDAGVAAIVKTHLPFGMPRKDSSTNAEKLLVQPHYLIWYDPDLRAPLWTAHRMTKEDTAKSRTRADSFRSDPRLAATEKSECSDDMEPIFDQGHMVPNGDMGRSNAAMDNTFLMSNMTPQHCAFNRGIWQVLEKRVRDWALEVDNTWVITGTVFDRKKPIGRDANADAWRMNGKKGRRVGIPNAQYKVIVREADGGGFETLTILWPNNDTIHTKKQIPKLIAGHITTLDAVAQRSGFRFLQSAQVSEESALFPAPKPWGGPLTAKCKANYPNR
jgi:endonuclease G